MNPAISDLSVILRGEACSSVISSDGEESSAKETSEFNYFNYYRLVLGR